MRAWRAACLTVALASSSAAASAEEPPAAVWRSFAGTWSVSGRREGIAVEGGGAAAIVDVSGAVVLTAGEGLSRGFRGQAIGFEDGRGSSVGRCVWTDASGDRIFSRLEGETLETGKRFKGAITGGTGRYAGLEGDYSFTWRYVLTGEEADGAVHGRVVDLAGRFHRGVAAR